MPNVSTTSTESTDTLDAVRTELLEMKAERERLTQQLMEAFKSGGSDDKSSMFAIASEQKAVEKRHVERIEALIDEHGWFASSDVGLEAHATAFEIVQQSGTVELQRRVLDALDEQEDDGENQVNRQRAMLIDTIREAEGRPQVYGMKVETMNGSIDVPPIENRNDLDERRAEMGLQPYDDYLAGLRKQLEKLSEQMS